MTHAHARGMPQGSAGDARREQPHAPEEGNAPTGHWCRAERRQPSRTFGWKGTTTALTKIVKRAHGTSRAIRSILLWRSSPQRHQNVTTSQNIQMKSIIHTKSPPQPQAW
jgi:hypothetical protein